MATSGPDVVADGNAPAPVVSTMLVAPVWRRRWVGLVGLGLLAGLIGGVVTATVAGMRRSATAFDRLLERSHVPDVAVRSIEPNALPRRAVDAVGRFPGVRSVESVQLFVGRTEAGRDWWAIRALPEFDGSGVLRPVLRDGRLPAPDAPDEVLLSVNTARLFGLDVGDRIGVGLYTTAQAQEFGRDTWTPPEGQAPELRVVGVYRDPLDAARSAAGTSVLAGPAFSAEYGAASGLDELLLTLDRGTTAADVDRRLATLGGSDASRGGQPVALAIDWLEPGRQGQAQSARVILIGLLAFAGVAAVAGVVVHGQSLRRWLQPLERDLPTWRTLGMSTDGRRRTLALALAPHALVATPAAVVVAVVLSVGFPIGVLRDIEPAPGLHADALVLVLGALATLGVTLASSVAVAALATRRHSDRRSAPRPATVLGAAEAVGMALPTAVGARFILRPVGRRRPLPVRTALVASVLAVAGVVAAGVFTSSLARLVDQPARYGTSWDLSMEMTSPRHGEAGSRRLEADPRVAAVAEPVTFDRQVDVGGHSVKLTALRMRKGASPVRPLDGRLPSGPDEIALGPRLLAELGLAIGDEVEVRSDVGPDGRLTVVGTALSPIYESSSFNAEAIVDVDALDARRPLDELGGFVLTLVTFRPGEDREALTADLDHRFDYAVMKESFPSPPPEIRNIDQVRGIPMALAAFLTMLGVAALTHALVVSTRSRRHDLGILRALGLDRRQTRRVVMSMGATVAAVGALLGPPVGVLVGAVGWRLVAAQLYIDPGVSVPVELIVGAVVVALVVGLAIAVVPARRTASVPTIEAVRSE